MGYQLPISPDSLTIAGHTVALGGSQNLAASDLTNGTTGTGDIVLATSPIADSPTFTGSILAQPASAVANILTLNNSGTLIEPVSYGLSDVRLSTNLNNTSMSDMDQFGLMVQAQVTGNSGSLIAYERGAALFWARTADPSGSTTRDCVGLDTRGYAAAGNTTSRIWGSVHLFEIETTADGLATGVEIDCTNNAATDQASPNTTTSKYGLAIYADGNTPITVGVALNRTNANYYHKGLWAVGGTSGMIGSGANDRFIELDNNFGGAFLFDVDYLGNINGNSLSLQTDLALEVSGSVLQVGNGFTGGIKLAGEVGVGTSPGSIFSFSQAVTVATGTAANYAAVELESGGTGRGYIAGNSGGMYLAAAGSTLTLQTNSGSDDPITLVNNTATFAGQIASSVSPSISWGICNTATITISNASNYAIAAGRGIVIVTNHANGDCGVYVVGGGFAALIATTQSTWVTPTTSPSTGKTSVDWNSGGNYCIYNNYGSSETFSVLLIATDNSN